MNRFMLSMVLSLLALPAVAGQGGEVETKCGEIVELGRPSEDGVGRESTGSSRNRPPSFQNNNSIVSLN